MDNRIVPIVLYQEVAERVRRKIYCGDLRPGEWIDEQALAKSFGISRTPLREALKVLHSEGLVVLRPRRGCFVAELTEQDLDEIFSVMALLEAHCAREAARKARSSEIERLANIHAELEELAAAGDTDRYYEENYTFHETVLELAGNPWLSRMVGDLRKFLKLVRGRQLRLPGRLQDSIVEHRSMMDALRRHDPDAAGKVMHDHLMAQRKALAIYDARERAAEEISIGKKR